MAKGSSKPKAKSRIESELDDYTRETAAKRDSKVIIFGVWFLIVFGLMAAFLLTTNQNVNTPPPAETAAPGATAASQVKALQDQLAKDPNNVGILIELGFAQIDARSYDEAAANLQKAAGLAPNNADAMVGLGMAFQSLNRPDDALAQYDKALKANPDHDLAKARKAYFLADVRGDYDGALRLLREVEARQPPGDIKAGLQAQIKEYEKELAK